jgi:hypothetical protein
VVHGPSAEPVSVLLAAHGGRDALEARFAAWETLDPGDEAEELLAWLAAMGRETLRRTPPPPAPPSLAAALAGRPAPDADHGQLLIDPPSVQARARAVGDARRVLLVGDDDGLAAALRDREVTVLDIDPRVLAFAAARGARTRRLDLFDEPLPSTLRCTQDVAVLDPIRNLEGTLQFLLVGRAAIVDDGEVLWVDHPAWNADYDEVRATLPSLGLEVVDREDALHAYPLAAAAFPQLGAAAARAGLDEAALARMVEATVAVSHLHRLRRRAPTP